MKRILNIVALLALLISAFPLVSHAATEPHFQFELSVDGGTTKEVHTGDVITVVLRLKRTDENADYTMYAMQDEIHYDGAFFELVEGSQVLAKDIKATDIGMLDDYREFYMNYLSTSGGTTWNYDTLVGSFQLRVIATSGVTKITNQDYLVSTKDGSGSYSSEANELTIILSSECTVHFESNGGSSVDDQVVQYGEKITRPDDPIRDGFRFEGWYKDINKTEAWDFENDVVQGNMTLYAAWKEADVQTPPSPGTSDGGNAEWLIPLAIVLICLIILIVLGRRMWISKNRKNRKP